MHNLTLKGQGQNLTPGQVRARSLGDPNTSNYTPFDALAETNAMTSLSHLDLKIMTKKLFVALSDLDDL